MDEYMIGRKRVMADYKPGFESQRVEGERRMYRTQTIQKEKKNWNGLTDSGNRSMTKIRIRDSEETPRSQKIELRQDALCICWLPHVTMIRVRMQWRIQDFLGEGSKFFLRGATLQPTLKTTLQVTLNGSTSIFEIMRFAVDQQY